MTNIPTAPPPAAALPAPGPGSLDSVLLARAIALAAAAHLDQWERDGTPYILHPIRVMGRVASVREKIVAILHDVVEDTPWTLDALGVEGFPADLLEALDSVTRREDETYEQFVDRAAANPIGFSVKLADLEDNLDFRRLPALTPADHDRMERYHRAWLKLRQRAYGTEKA